MIGPKAYCEQRTDECVFLPRGYGTLENPCGREGHVHKRPYQNDRA